MVQGIRQDGYLSAWLSYLAEKNTSRFQSGTQYNTRLLGTYCENSAKFYQIRNLPTSKNMDHTKGQRRHNRRRNAYPQKNRGNRSLQPYIQHYRHQSSHPNTCPQQWEGYQNHKTNCTEPLNGFPLQISFPLQYANDLLAPRASLPQPMENSMYVYNDGH